MKTVLLVLIGATLGSAAIGQNQSDDLYFTRKDRVSVKTNTPAEEDKKAAFERKHFSDTNPTDSYSARNVNPEYTAREHAETATIENENYFLRNFVFNTNSNLNNFNNNLNAGFYNPYYNGGYYGSNINSWNSPYYGFNDPYSSPWCNPSWGNTGFSSSFSYYYGNSWNYGWGNSYNGWGRPVINIIFGSRYGYGWNNWNNGWGNSWNNGWGGGWNRPILISNPSKDANGQKVIAGRRPVRNNSVISGNHGRQPGYANSGGRNNSGGRSSGSHSRATNSSAYYSNTWRNQSTDTPVRSRYSSGSSDNSDRRQSYSPSRSSFSSGSSSGGSRSSSFSTGGGGRSSGGGGSSPSRSSSGGGTRSRN